MKEGLSMQANYVLLFLLVTHSALYGAASDEPKIPSETTLLEQSLEDSPKKDPEGTLNFRTDDGKEEIQIEVNPKTSLENSFSLSLMEERIINSNLSELKIILEKFKPALTIRQTYLAAEKSVAVMSLLEQHKAPLDLLYNGVTPLGMAALKSNLPVVEFLCSKEVNVNTPLRSNSSALHAAAVSGNIAIIERLLHSGAQINWQDQTGKTPLHKAIIKRNVEATSYLINKGALLLADKEGNTPIHLIVECEEFHEILSALLAKIPEVENQNQYGHTPLHIAAIEGNINVIDLLLPRTGCDIQDMNGFTPLHVAIMAKNKKASLYLIEKGVNITVPDHKGRTALHYAALYNLKSVVPALLNRGAYISAQDINGDKPCDFVVDDIEMLMILKYRIC